VELVNDGVFVPERILLAVCHSCSKGRLLFENYIATMENSPV
jgi:hypothetical protein